MFGKTSDFTANKFASTKWEKAESKVKFARQFIRFVESDFNRRQFPHWFYLRLALTFGHIAHFNQATFFETFFASTEGKVRFLRMTLKHECWGDPAYTYADVERAIQSWLHQNGVVAKYEQRMAEEQEADERAQLARLQTKYAEKGGKP